MARGTLFATGAQPSMAWKRYPACTRIPCSFWMNSPRSIRKRRAKSPICSPMAEARPARDQLERPVCRKSGAAPAGGRQGHQTGSVCPADRCACGCGSRTGLFENLHGCASGAAFSQRLQANACRYYGTAIRAFLAKLTQPSEQPAAREQIKALTQAFLDG